MATHGDDERCPNVMVKCSALKKTRKIKKTYGLKAKV